jgi:arginyl-tRNA--protein-N-Asp/Glu arginylyltransferase
MQGFDVQRLHYIGTDLFSYYVAPALAEMSEEEFALYLQYHYAVCERADMVGATAHALDIFRKNGVGDARIMA